ncbi:hypothetical protein [Haloflavibacter putidus]|uniref:Uncharacterized protein n=1 Tax=Haloflavibacter putidus TaxID=2576776 RepID=A0A507ZAV2_9FLAO|nr:hypothetical protein [Haloflavibacter putidus]TQD34037.1 hypothetical protein FKR84_12515 [Haloflavibacter putidus]
MKKNITKYGILSFFGIAMIYQFIPIGDYCSGLLSGLNFLFFAGLLILTFFIVTIINLIKIYKKKQKFDLFPLILILSFGIIGYIIMSLENKKFWTTVKLSGIIQVEGRSPSGTLKLYKNGTFGATYHSIEYSCTFQGEYKLKNNKLQLERKDILIETDSIFTNQYVLNTVKESLTPINKSFKTIKIIK